MENRMCSAKERFKIMERDDFRCFYCGINCSKTEIHIDHIVPYSKGGLSDVNNLATTCQTCNLGKSNLEIKAIDKYLKEIARRNIEFDMIKKINPVKNPVIKNKKNSPKKQQSTTIREAFWCTKLNIKDSNIDELVESILGALTIGDKKLIKHVIENGENEYSEKHPKVLEAIQVIVKNDDIKKLTQFSIEELFNEDLYTTGYSVIGDSCGYCFGDFSHYEKLKSGGSRHYNIRGLNFNLTSQCYSDKKKEIILRLPTRFEVDEEIMKDGNKKITEVFFRVLENIME